MLLVTNQWNGFEDRFLSPGLKPDCTIVTDGMCMGCISRPLTALYVEEASPLLPYFTPNGIQAGRYSSTTSIEKAPMQA